MTNHKIRNSKELRAEINRLKALTKNQEQQLRVDLQEIKKSLSPINFILNGVSAITGISVGKHDILKKGALIGLSLLAQQFMRKAEHSVEDKVSEWIEKFYAQLKIYLGKINPFGKKEESKHSGDPEDEL